MKLRQKIRSGIIFSSFLFFPVVFYYLSPYLIIDATSKRIINGSFICFLLLFISSLFFGRAYCGWVCPASGCQESISRFIEKKVGKGDFIKWIIWIPWVFSIIFIAIKTHGYKEIDFLYQTSYGISIYDKYSFITYISVLLLIVIPCYLIGSRSFCHHLCWMAPFMIIGRKIRNIIKWPSLHLVSFSEKCVHCHICSSNCPMSLNVEDMVNKKIMENSECILCGSCVDGCKKGAIIYKFFD